MRNWARNTVLVVCGALVGAVCGGALTISYAAQPKGGMGSFTEKVMGSVPVQWGELVGVTCFDQRTTTLIFCDDKLDKGKLRRVQWHATGMLEVVGVVERRS